MRLRQTSPEQPGWRRRRAGRGFVYLDSDGRRLEGEAAQRCRELVIPPAWQDVWICPYPNGHLQAVGTDSKGRRQYLYHPEWRRQRDLEKFEHVRHFATELPRARRDVAENLHLDGMPPERALATAFRLLDRGYFRIGSDTYTTENGSHGLTTLLRSQVRRTGDRLLFSFPAKSASERLVEVTDQTTIDAVNAMRRRRQGPEELLAFRQRRGWHHLDATMVNEYLKELLDEEVSAKDFRTWHGTVRAAVALARRPASSKTAKRRAVAAAMREVAEHLGNTATVARSAYVDPVVVDQYLDGRTIASALDRAERRRNRDRRAEDIERAVRRLLRDVDPAG